jgi:hypothetical protein
MTFDYLQNVYPEPLALEPSMEGQLCAECRDADNPVNVENGVSIPDRDGKVVMVHAACAGVWTLCQS